MWAVFLLRYFSIGSVVGDMLVKTVTKPPVIKFRVTGTFRSFFWFLSVLRMSPGCNIGDDGSVARGSPLNSGFEARCTQSFRNHEILGLPLFKFVKQRYDLSRYGKNLSGFLDAII